MRFRAPPEIGEAVARGGSGSGVGEAPKEKVQPGIIFTPPKVEINPPGPPSPRKLDVPFSTAALLHTPKAEGDAGLTAMRSHTQVGRLQRMFSEDGRSSPGRDSRRGSYVGGMVDASARTRARRFTQARTMSIMQSARDKKEHLDGSLHAWASGRAHPLSDPGSKTPVSQAPAPELLTAAEVETYHKLLEGLQHITGLHDCVDHPCGNIYWDFRTKRCLPGRVWKDKMPEDVRAKVDRAFTPEEITEIEHQINLKTAPSNPEDVEPRALFLIGPAAAGKSAVRSKTEDMLQIKMSDYVEIDGDEFRDKHRGWMEVLKGDRTTGYKDALNVLLPYTRELKKRVMAEAMAGRKNILLPSTASNFDKLLREVDNVSKKGYRVDVVGLVVSFREARARALNRAHENGRWNDGTKEKWEAAMRAICHFMEPEFSDWCIVFDNEDFCSPSTIFSRTHSLSFVENVIAVYRSQDAEYAERVQRQREEEKKKEKDKKDKKEKKENKDKD
eukprot:Hpha_TRINITY_DN16820_c6_g3::TRINITY_DN16820_c6_g3_i1::g.151471::m.151471